MTGVERYRDIVPDWEAFIDSIGAPEPVAIRVRAALTDEASISDRLHDQGFRVASAGVDGFLVAPDGPGSVAQTVEHWLGLFHIQQSVMGLPSLALAPRPGERVLDLCAAPGGKTTHLSELMREEGPLVAVDPKEKRLRGLLANVYRLGHPNIIVIAADGRDVPPGIDFDRVLVDAPCSGEGNVRRQGGRLPTRSTGFDSYIRSVQVALLRRGIEATRPGGRIVYSTCTFAPEENESIVNQVLQDGTVAIEPIDLSAPHASGLTTWNGVRFDPRLRHAWRVYPHQLDSGGLFMVRLRRLEGPSRSAEGGAETPSPADDSLDGWAAIPRGFPGSDLEAARERITAAIRELEYRFGYPRDLLASLGWLERRDHLWAHTAGEWPVPAFEAAGRRWRVVSVGLRALKRSRDGRETPSNVLLTRWAAQLPSARRLEVDHDQLAALLSGARIPVKASVVGPIALVWRKMILGRGMIDRKGRLWHELGNAQAQRLQQLMADPEPERER